LAAKAAAAAAQQQQQLDDKGNPIVQPAPPPIYPVRNSVLYQTATGKSPPPTYEDSLLDQLYQECVSLDGGSSWFDEF
jgi:hypothetical protein